MLSQVMHILCCKHALENVEINLMPEYKCNRVSFLSKLLLQVQKTNNIPNPQDAF